MLKLYVPHSNWLTVKFETQHWFCALEVEAFAKVWRSHLGSHPTGGFERLNIYRVPVSNWQASCNGTHYIIAA
jgi:allantoicase